MKKIVLIFLAVLLGTAFSSISAKEKKKNVKVEETVKPVTLSSSSDTLSYAAGMMMSDGLIPYLQKQEGVDTAYMADFVKGFEEMISNDNPKFKAYAVGMSIATRMKSQMVGAMKKDFTDTPDSVVTSLVYRGFTDALQGDTTLFKQKDAEKIFKEKRQANEEAKDEKLYGANRSAGKAFLAENAKKEGVKTTASGLQYKVITEGTGKIPAKTDKVQVNYEGKLIDGTVFDSSAKHGDKPATFRPDQVIKGWTEALTMMPVGSKWELYIPQELAYGKRDMGQIKPYSTLIFTVELVGIE